jgi:C2H2 type zinc finger protein
MPSSRCPRCGKKFKDQTNLLQHMNQPFSSCLTHFEECINIATTLQSDPTISEGDNLDRQSFEPPGFMDTAEDCLLASSRSSPPASTSQNPEDKQNPFNIKKHPTSGSVYGRGETFMDQCDKDRFTEKRTGHLYYPFASRDEWELASFLLRSRLSMAAIDRFLKLNMVSYTSKM